MIEVVKLGDICTMQSGGTPRRNKSEYYQGGSIPWAKIGDIENANDNYLTETKELITELGLKSINNRLFPKGTLLFAMYGSVGKTAIAGRELSTNQAILGIQPKSNFLDTKYLQYWLNRQLKDLQNQSRGVALKNLSATIMKNQEIPLPPLSTQKKITTILDRADALRQNDKKILEKYDQLAKSLFLEMFGDPVRNEKGWEHVLFGNVVKDIIGGKSIGGEERSLKEGELAVLKISSVTKGEFDNTQYKVVSNPLSNIKLIMPRQGDLLFSRANTRELVGATCIVDKDYDQFFLPDKLWRLELDNKLANSHYIKFLLSDKKFRDTLTKTATGTSGSMLNISKVKLRSLHIPLPPIELQMRFQRAMKKIEEQKNLTKNSLQKSEELFQSLLQRAFRGELL